MAGRNSIKVIEEEVERLFEEKLPAGMYFHNINHTRNVVAAATDIAAANRLTDSEIYILTIAAWFHDTGYCYLYHNHEEASIAIAFAKLTQMDFEWAVIQQVNSCIGATRMPQKPDGLIQEVLCDADMAHLAKEDYFSSADQLRQEWAAKLGKVYTDPQWYELNLHMLSHHHYCSPYGKLVLEPMKQANIDQLKGLLNTPPRP